VHFQVVDRNATFLYSHNTSISNQNASLRWQLLKQRGWGKKMAVQVFRQLWLGLVNWLTIQADFSYGPQSAWPCNVFDRNRP
jgi:hypothetical protein